jgi:tRNA(Ile)-lysidine synthase TilS/MesJ
MNNINGNITFFLEEKNSNKGSNDFEIQKMLSEFDEEYIPIVNEDMIYYTQKKFYGDDELYYTHEYTVKELMQICNYYGIDKHIKTSKCKKQDIISTIVFFESLPENFESVQQRHKMWAYIKELINDSKMKKYVIWN